MNFIKDTKWRYYIIDNTRWWLRRNFISQYNWKWIGFQCSYWGCSPKTVTMTPGLHSSVFIELGTFSYSICTVRIHLNSASSNSSSSMLCLPASKQSSDSSPPEKIIQRDTQVPSIVGNINDNLRYDVPNNSSFFNSTEILKQTLSSTSESRSFESSTSPADPTAP